MAMEYDNHDAFCNLSKYYEDIQNHEKLIKYYMKFIEKYPEQYIISFVEYCKRVLNVIAFTELCDKYYHIISMTIYADNIMKGIIYFVDAEMITNELLDLIVRFDMSKCTIKIPYLFKIFTNQLREKVDLMELHFNYSMVGKGFAEAKNNFFDKIRLQNISDQN